MHNWCEPKRLVHIRSSCCVFVWVYGESSVSIKSPNVWNMFSTFSFELSCNLYKPYISWGGAWCNFSANSHGTICPPNSKPCGATLAASSSVVQLTRVFPANSRVYNCRIQPNSHHKIFIEHNMWVQIGAIHYFSCDCPTLPHSAKHLTNPGLRVLGAADCGAIMGDEPGPPLKKRRGGVQQRLQASALENAPSTSKLATHLLEEFALGKKSPQECQRLASLAVKDMTDAGVLLEKIPVDLRKLSKLGSGGRHLNNCYRDIMRMTCKHSVHPHALFNEHPNQAG